MPTEAKAAALPSSRPVHRPIGWRPWTEYKLDQVKLGPVPPRKYGRRWRKLRAAYLAAHPLCECGCDQVAAVVDHKRPHNGDDALMYAWDNLQAMTKACHDRKTAGRDGGFGNRRRTTQAPSEGPGRGVQT